MNMNMNIDQIINAYKTLNLNDKRAFKKEFFNQTGASINEFNNPITVGVAVCEVIDEYGDIKLLAIVRGDKKDLAFPGGYQEANENLSQTASRELLEETNIFVDPKNFQVIENHMATNGNSLIFLKTKTPLNLEDIKNFKATNEALEIKLIDDNDKLCFETHNLVLHNFFNNSLKKLIKRNIK